MYQRYFKASVLSTLIFCLMASVDVSGQSIPGNTVRVRVFQGKNITLYPASYCYGKDTATTIHAAVSGFGIFATHKRLAMPLTDDISGAYNEYALKSGQAVTVSLQWEVEKNGVKITCGPLGTTFYPQSGKDYDVMTSDLAACAIQVRELIETAPGKAYAIPVSSSPSYPCAGN